MNAAKDGLHASGHDCVHEPEAFEIDEVARFEGETNPDDQAILFALRCDAHGVKGTWSAAYGPAMPPDDAEMARRLGRKEREARRD